MNDNRKNFNQAPISNVNGSVTFGDNSGNITNIYYSSAEYESRKIKLDKLNIEFEKLQEQKRSHPEVSYFITKLIEVDSERTQIQKELDDFISGIKKILDEYQHFSDNTTGRLRLVNQHFEAGKLDEARAILDAEKMDEELNALLKQKERLSNSISENDVKLNDKANEFLIKAYLTSIDFTLLDRFEKTRDYYQRSLSAARNGRNLSAFARFLYQHNQLQEALPLFIEASIIYSSLALTSQEFLPDVALISNELGITLSKLGNPSTQEFIDAEKAFKLAIENYRRLPETFHPGLAEALHNLGNLLSQKGDFTAAEEAYDEALNIYRGLSKDFLPGMAAMLHDIGNSKMLQDKAADAGEPFSRALKIYRRLTRSNKQFLPNLANTLSSLARQIENATEKTTALDAAEKLYIEAFKINQQLVMINPNAFMLDSAGTMVNMSLFYQRKKPNKNLSLALVRQAAHYIFPFIMQIESANQGLQIMANIIGKWELEAPKVINDWYTKFYEEFSKHDNGVSDINKLVVQFYRQHGMIILDELNKIINK
ncbi:tetratricopeptide repeat protein [Pontibacter sp. 172403-2]|uniref:tetratricopeptide repeat protein n=1 Tax=Pontibacter rufus TaxID=2791028 RepID=UPI0018AFC06E|nr:tetratricopeptide repeat protein [Pontibacter sp. 172403-2]MBF9253220.1 tetratricopeptide repeat protein [Pontibacter sp. 172403-2]